MAEPSAKTKTPADVKCRVWQGVWWNPPTAEEFCEWASSKFENGEVRYIQGQLERGEESGNLHFQFMCYFVNAVRLSTVMALRPNSGIHWVPCGDRFAENDKYTSKSETRVLGPWEWGDRPNPGRRSDLDHYSRMIVRGEITDIRQLDLLAPRMSVQYGRGFENLIARSAPDRDFPTKGWFLWGPSGVGKTYGYPKRTTYRPIFEPVSQTFSFYGYRRHELVVFDDQDVASIPMDLWSNFTNDGPMLLPVKGRDPVSFVARNVVIISSFEPPESLTSQERWTRRYEVVHVSTILESTMFWSRVLGTPV